jgi:hypothetical protein
MFNSFVKTQSGVMMPMFNRQAVFFIELAESACQLSNLGGKIFVVN